MSDQSKLVPRPPDVVVAPPEEVAFCNSILILRKNLVDSGEIDFWNLFIEDMIASNDAMWHRRLNALKSHTTLLRATLEMNRATLSVKDRARLANVETHVVKIISFITIYRDLSTRGKAHFRKVMESLFDHAK